MAAEDTRLAFETMTSDLSRRVADPAAALRLTPEQRSQLISFAEANNQGHAGVAPAKQGLGRVQALYVAGTLATLDEPGTPNPFRDAELHKAYADQQKFMSPALEQETSARGFER